MQCRCNPRTLNRVENLNVREEASRRLPGQRGDTHLLKSFPRQMGQVFR
jgi:hypothetical protein